MILIQFLRLKWLECNRILAFYDTINIIILMQLKEIKRIFN